MVNVELLARHIVEYVSSLPHQRIQVLSSSGFRIEAQPPLVELSAEGKDLAGLKD
jgi:hypothetical protein